MSDTDTKDRILDTAEKLFSDKGFEAASLRAITAEAGVNLAAVHYHFGSKEALLQAVLARRADPINQERLRLLNQAVATAAPNPPPVEAIVHAFLWPALRVSNEPGRGGPAIMRLMGKMFAETDEQIDDILTQLFGPVGRRFNEQLARALPHLDRSDMAWRFLFMLGTMAFTMSDRRKLHFLSQGKCTSTDVEAARDQLIAFISGGLRAPAPAATGEIP